MLPRSQIYVHSQGLPVWQQILFTALACAIVLGLLYLVRRLRNRWRRRR